jgi:hypothetical protein
MTLQEIEETIFSDNQKLDINDYQIIRDVPNESITATDIATLAEIYFK